MFLWNSICLRPLGLQKPMEEINMKLFYLFLRHINGQRLKFMIILSKINCHYMKYVINFTFNIISFIVVFSFPPNLSGTYP